MHWNAIFFYLVTLDLVLRELLLMVRKLCLTEASYICKVLGLVMELFLI